MRRLLFLTTYRQIRSSFWVGREAARSKIKLAQKETRRQDRTPGRAPAAERGRGSGTGQSKASLGSCVLPNCVASCSSAVAQVQALRSGGAHPGAAPSCEQEILAPSCPASPPAATTATASGKKSQVCVGCPLRRGGELGKCGPR